MTKMQLTTIAEDMPAVNKPRESTGLG